MTTSTDLAAQVGACLQAEGVEAEVDVHPNRGRDVLPFLHVADRLCNEGVELVLKLHTKRSVHRDDGARWFDELIAALLPPAGAQSMVEAFEQDATLGMVAPAGHLLPLADYLGGNAGALDHLSARLGIATHDPEAVFASGTMFWARVQALRPLLDAHLYPAEFEDEQGQVDGTLAHALERTFCSVVIAAGHRVASSDDLEGRAPPRRAPYPYARRSCGA